MLNCKFNKILLFLTGLFILSEVKALDLIFNNDSGFSRQVTIIDSCTRPVVEYISTKIPEGQTVYPVPEEVVHSLDEDRTLASFGIKYSGGACCSRPDDSKRTINMPPSGSCEWA